MAVELSQARGNGKGFVLRKFTPDRYPNWAAAVRSTLKVNECLDIVLGTEEKPVLGDNPTQQLRTRLSRWELRDSLARDALLNSLAETELDTVSELEHSHQIWSRLKDEYSVITEYTYNLAETAFRSLRKSKTTSLSDHIAAFI
jgi:hypothetical protein